MSDSQLDRIEKSVERIDKALFTGNGSPPLLSRVATLEERTNNQNRVSAALWGLVLGLLGFTNFK